MSTAEHSRARRASHHGDDVRLVREPHRAQAQQARRRVRDRQLRDREGHGRLRPRRRQARGPARRRRGRRLPGRSSCRRARSTAAATSITTSPRTRPRRCAGGSSSPRVLSFPVLLMAMVPGAAVRQLAVAEPAAGHARSSSGARGRSTARRGRTPGTRPRRWTRSSPSACSPRGCGRCTRCSSATPGCRACGCRSSSSPSAAPAADHIYLEVAVRRDDAHPARPLLRGARQAPRRRRPEGAAGARRQGRRRPRRARPRDPHPRRAARASGSASSCAPARRSPPTASSRKARRAIDMSMLTGESVPVEVSPGSEVAGATVNAGGRLVVRATKVGADTALAQIAKLVTDAQTGKAPVQRLADRVSGIFVPDRHRPRRRHARLLAGHAARARASRSRPRSRCSSSPARARSASRPRPR